VLIRDTRRDLPASRIVLRERDLRRYSLAAVSARQRAELVSHLENEQAPAVIYNSKSALSGTGLLPLTARQWGAAGLRPVRSRQSLSEAAFYGVNGRHGRKAADRCASLHRISGTELNKRVSDSLLGSAVAELPHEFGELQPGL
jgi:hypothetical protein